MDGPLRYLVQAPRSNEMATWLLCNDIAPTDVAYRTDVFVSSADGTDWFVEFDGYARTSAGVIRYDAATEAFVLQTRRVPLLNDPPMFWLRETAPTGDGAASAGPAGAETAAGDQTVAAGACNED
jgi:hypothetical protein